MRRLFAIAGLVVACGASGPLDPVPTPGAQDLKACGSLNEPSCACSTGGTCDVDCNQQTSCTSDCSGGSTCGVIGCHGDTECTLSCSGGSQCDYVDCRGATSCAVDCSGGSTCDVNCSDATSCTLTCSGGSPCLVYCGGRPGCSITACSSGAGVPTTCPNDIVVCNRACPTCGDGICDRVASETCSSCSADCGKC